MKRVKVAPPVESMPLKSRSQHTHDPRSGPPPEVLDAIAAAWERAREPLGH
jgi:hypothetical protein